MFSRFFIEHPVFANVIAVLTVIFGLVTVFKLPVEQYPDITPPTVQVTTTYPGASAQVVADTVASPIEEQVNGVEHMLYMSSTSASDGSYTLTVTFDVGTDTDIDSGVGAESRADRRSAVAAGGATGRPRHAEAIDRHRALRDAHFARQTVRQPVLEQLCHDQSAGRIGPAAGRRANARRRRRHVQHANVARRRQAHGPQSHDAGCRQRGAGAERASGGRRHRRAADEAQAGVPIHGHHQGPADHAGGIRQYHPQSGARARPPKSRGSKTWPASNSVRKPTINTSRSTASRPPASPSISFRGPTRSTWPNASGKRWSNSRAGFRKGSSTIFPSTPPNSSPPRSTKSIGPWAKPACSCCS